MGQIKPLTVNGKWKSHISRGGDETILSHAPAVDSSEDDLVVSASSSCELGS